MTAAYPEYMKVSMWALGVLPLGVVMCAQAVEHDEVAFSDLSVAVPWREVRRASIISSSACI